MRGRTVHRETERKETRGGRKEKRGRKKKEGRKVKRGGQYWYKQYFPESSSICNTGITNIFQNVPVSAILV
jgi:hypothetical protein